MDSATVWFVVIAGFWAGYFLLEGFDFGVGILLPVLGRSPAERSVILHTIGPVWDGNEVWLIVAGGATFAAFPDWYATLCSGFYLPLLVILVALILRGIGLEYRGKVDDPGWRRRWELAIFTGSLLPAAGWGVVFGNLVRGVPLDANHEYTGDLPALLNPYALLGGATTLALFTLHGAVFLALKTDGGLRRRAGILAPRIGAVAAVLAVGFLGWTGLAHPDRVARGVAGIAVLALVAGLVAAVQRREGWAFLGTGAAIIAATVALFVTLYPAVLPASTGAAFDLTVQNAAATPYTLKIMTIVAVVITPFVLAYQGWTYWVFRQRLRVPGGPRPAPDRPQVPGGPRPAPDGVT